MALISCPECQAQISELAKSCPKCGCPISAVQKDFVKEETHTEFIENKEPELVNENKNDNSKISILALIIGAGSLAVLALVLVLIFSNMNSSDEAVASDDIKTSEYQGVEATETKETSSNVLRNDGGLTNSPSSVYDESQNTDVLDNITTSIDWLSELMDDTRRDDNYHYLIYGSDARYVTVKDLYGFSKEECSLARNEIFARHGRLFSTDSIQDYFNGMSWYYGRISPDDFSDSVLNEYEKANVKFIKEFEENEMYNEYKNVDKDMAVKYIPFVADEGYYYVYLKLEFLDKHNGNMYIYIDDENSGELDTECCYGFKLFENLSLNILDYESRDVITSACMSIEIDQEGSKSYWIDFSNTYFGNYKLDGNLYSVHDLYYENYGHGYSYAEEQVNEQHPNALLSGQYKPFSGYCGWDYIRIEMKDEYTGSGEAGQAPDFCDLYIEGYAPDFFAYESDTGNYFGYLVSYDDAGNRILLVEDKDGNIGYYCLQ